MSEPILRQTMETTILARDEAMRRLWRARDEAEKRRRALDDAEAALSFAQSDYDEWTRQLRELWPLFRAEIERIPVVDDPEVSA